MTREHEEILKQFREFASVAPTAEEVMKHIAQRLHETMTRYNWVGFYLVDPADNNILEVGPFVGSFTPNSRIPLNTGLCGAAASSGKTVVVDDVSKDKRSLAGQSSVTGKFVVLFLAKANLGGNSIFKTFSLNLFLKPEKNLSKA